MEIEQLKEHWNSFGETDPLWAILTAPGKRGGRWDLDEFLSTGRDEVEAILGRIQDLGIAVERGRALDFGCGVGRLSQALAERFGSCDGIDIASSMIERACELNRYEDRCHFHLGEGSDLRLFGDGTFDFVLALIVLQHMEPRYIRGYLREFMRVLRPGGVAFFNVPAAHLFGTELPRPARNAEIRLSERLGELHPRETRSIDVFVTNRSMVTWPASSRILLGTHWLDAGGSTLPTNDARTAVSGDLGPGESQQLTLDITAPGQAGGYELELDLLQEHHGWFGTTGSPTLRLPVAVAGADSKSTPVSTSVVQIEPIMEMHTMDEADVVTELERAGGVVLDVRPMDRCGPTIESLDYVVARATGAGRSRKRGNAERRTANDHLGRSLRTARTELLHAKLAELARLEDEAAAAASVRDDTLSKLGRAGNLLGFKLSSERGVLGRFTVPIRRVLRRLMLQVLDRQSRFNATVPRVLSGMAGELTLAKRLVEAQRETLTLAEERIEALERDQSETSAAVRELERLHALAGLRHEQERRSTAPLEKLDIDYLDLTNRFRGSTEEIVERQRRYVEHFKGATHVVDIGCGRGEFLSQLRDAGVRAVGVDLEESMVTACRSLGHDAVLADGLEYLEGQGEDSLGGVFAAQMIEHLSTEDLVRLVRLAFSRLLPGGALVLETVNPACLIVFATFYADFTHNRPVHPEALRWLAESAGFAAAIEYTMPVAADRRFSALRTRGIPPEELEDFNRGIAFADHLLFDHQEYALIAHKPL